MKKSAVILFPLTIVIAAFACEPPPPRCPEPIVIVSTDAAAPLEDETTVIVTDPDGGITEYTEPFDVAGGYASPVCASACANLLRFQCPEGKVKPGEDSCYVVCRRAEGTGGRIDFKPRCVTAARSKTAIRACRTYRC